MSIQVSFTLKCCKMQRFWALGALRDPDIAKKLITSITVAAGLLYSANAANIAIDPETAPAAGNQEFGGSLGLDFIDNSPIVVSQIGAFDDDGDGMNRDISLKLNRVARVNPLEESDF